MRELRSILGSKIDNVAGEWIKRQNEKLGGLYSTPNIVQMIKSRKITCAGHVARTGDSRGV